MKRKDKASDGSSSCQTILYMCYSKDTTTCCPYTMLNCRSDTEPKSIAASTIKRFTDSF